MWPSAAQSLSDGPEASAAMPSRRIMRRRKVAQAFEGCLTTTCTGAAEAQFTWVQVRPLGGPVMSGVRRSSMRGQPLMRSSMRIAKWTLVLAFSIALLDGGTSAQSKAPRFEDFPVTTRFSGKPANVRLMSRIARRFRTVIREQAKQGANFAGHYTVVEIGCGAACVELAVVNAKTGDVYFQPFPIMFGMMEDQQELLRNYPQQYRRDSRLLIAFGSPKNGGKGMYFYKWEKNRFRLIYTALKKN
jgi:hypothetical protein